MEAVSDIPGESDGPEDGSFTGGGGLVLALLQAARPGGRIQGDGLGDGHTYRRHGVGVFPEHDSHVGDPVRGPGDGISSDAAADGATFHAGWRRLRRGPGDRADAAHQGDGCCAAGGGGRRTPAETAVPRRNSAGAGRGGRLRALDLVDGGPSLRGERHGGLLHGAELPHLERAVQF